MRLSYVACLFCLLASTQSSETKKESHEYQSDVARMRKIVINSLYSHREIFIRELISNSNDALEKLRLVSLTDKDIIDSSAPLNISIKAIKDEDSKGGKLVITDTGIGMTPEEMVTNLGTLAKSGTSEFIARAESGVDGGNLIGSFGLGFYSSFLVADEVQVASLPPKSSKNPNPEQYIFTSKADENSFETYADPRGNSLGHGTEITLTLRGDATDFLDTDNIKNLVAKHSSFSTTYPIWLLTEEEEEIEIPDDLGVPPAKKDEESDNPAKDGGNDEVLMEEESNDEEVAPDKKTIKVMNNKWVQLNAQAPIWMRDPKAVTDDEYKEFYKTTFKDHEDPLAWHHFQGDSGSGVSFRAIIFIPGSLGREFWHNPIAESNVRLMVKRVFITNNLGEDGVAKWASWLKVIIDAEDLPLNVSRESLQSNKFVRQIKQIVVKRLIQLLTQISEKDPEKYQEINRIYGNTLKLGVVEDEKDRYKLAGLIRFATNQRNSTSLDDYVSHKKKGQKQIFYFALIGQRPEVNARSIFIEKLTARGYEVFLLSDPLDEFLFTSLRTWQGLDFQDTAKKGLLFGDEDTSEDEKLKEEELKASYAPLLKYLKSQVGDLVQDVVISNRLVSSPCAIVAEEYGYSANMERIMNAQNTKKSAQFMHEFAKKQKLLEVNPHSPLIEGLLKRVKQLDFDNEERDGDQEAEEELKEITSILIDGASVRSGFDVADSNLFFTRIDRVLRRSLGVSENARPNIEITPAPPVEEGPLHSKDAKPAEAASEDVKPVFELPDDLKDKLSVEVEEIPDDEDDFGNKLPHDEL